MKTSIPKKIKVDHLTYTITLDPGIGDIGHFGLCNSNDQIIRLYSKMNKERMKETLLHEVLHAIYYSRGMRQVPNESLTEELIVDQIGVGLITVLNNNPELRKYLLSS